MDYQSFIASNLWKSLREKRLEIDGYKCRCCRWAEDLEVHHVYDGTPSFRYPKPLGQEDPEEDLITLCKWCHEGVTNAARQRRYDNKDPIVIEYEQTSRVFIEVGNGSTKVEISDYRGRTFDYPQRPDQRPSERFLQAIEGADWETR